MEKKVCLTSFFTARYVPGAGEPPTFGNSGTGGCSTVQSEKSFSILAFIPAVSKSPHTPSTMFAGKK